MPQEIDTFKALQLLDISYNNIETLSISSEICVLIAKDNLIKTVPRLVCPYLTKLILLKNNLTELNLDSQSISNLTHLDLR